MVRLSKQDINSRSTEKIHNPQYCSKKQIGSNRLYLTNIAYVIEVWNYYLLVGAPRNHSDVNGLNVSLFSDGCLTRELQLVALLHSG